MTGSFSYQLGSIDTVDGTTTANAIFTWGSATNTTASVTTADWIADSYIADIAWSTWAHAQKRIARRKRKTVPPEALEPIRRAPPPREFNRYVNGSDLLQEFIRFLGQHQVRRAEALKIPLEHFIQWLIVEAAKADNEPPPIQLRLPTPKPRCLQCSRVLKKRTSLLLCSAACVRRRLQAAA